MIGYLRGDSTVNYCRNGEEIGDKYKSTYGSPVNEDGYGICPKVMMIMYPIMESLRSGGDLRNIGGDTKYTKDIVCPDGCVLFRLHAKNLINRIFPLKQLQSKAVFWSVFYNKSMGDSISFLYAKTVYWSLMFLNIKKNPLILNL